MKRITKSYYNYYSQLKAYYMERISSSAVNNNKGHYLSKEEIEQIIQLSLLTSMITFDNRLSAFNTFLYSNLYNNLRKEIQKNRKKQIPSNVFNTTTLCKLERKLFIEEILSCLEQQESDIVNMYYLQNMSIREISEKLGPSMSTVYNIKNKALTKIKASFNPEDIDVFSV